MGWLLSQVITAILGAVVIVTVFELVFTRIVGPLANAGKQAVFVGVGTAITTGLGVVGVKKAARRLRQASKEAEARILVPGQKRSK